MKKEVPFIQDRTEAAAPSPGMDRREFLKRMGLLGGGLVIYGTLGDLPAEARALRTGLLGSRVPSDFNAFLRIDPDNRVTCFVGKIEMGQGVITSFAQMAAEELDVAYESVEMVLGDTDLCPWDAGTWGSLSTRYYGIFVKEAACEARAVLLDMAAERLSCPRNRLSVKNGLVWDRERPGIRVTYGALTAGRIIERHLSELPRLKPASAYTTSGRPFLRRDAIRKVLGKARFAGDIRLPGMGHLCHSNIFVAARARDRDPGKPQPVPEGRRRTRHHLHGRRPGHGGI
ncbi:molybdopterin cofactor-binding domain-containing protein [Desulfococcus sp.]|uniref:molybdopterin cofactor-binding domain-containing protein n=1 Tax=Desulfococcus sp. TaxID=2025834 RepID=UPI003D0CE46D